VAVIYGARDAERREGNASCRGGRSVLERSIMAGGGRDFRVLGPNAPRRQRRARPCRTRKLCSPGKSLEGSLGSALPSGLCGRTFLPRHVDRRKVHARRRACARRVHAFACLGAGLVGEVHLCGFRRVRIN